MEGVSVGRDTVLALPANQTARQPCGDRAGEGGSKDPHISPVPLYCLDLGSLLP